MANSFPDADAAATDRAGLTDRAWLALLPLCFASGCAALIYEVVWFRLLELVIGASAVSLGVVLATFMSGLCLGSLLLWRVVSSARHPLRVFACLELGIAALGLALLVAMPAIGSGYAALAGTGVSGLALRAAVAGACLLPPTVLMGATLPALARFVGSTPRGASRTGLLYGANVIGAVAGSLAAGFYLLRVYDVAVATAAAAAVNIAAALAAFALARALPFPRPGTAPRTPGAPARIRADAWPVYVSIGLSGMTALAAEVIWTRHLSLLLGATVYTFALILAVFLLGLALGSAAGSALSRRVSARDALGACQLLAAAGIVWGAYAIARSLPYWPLDVTLPVSPSVALQLDLIRTAWAILPAALLWGASFPLALAAVTSQGQDPGRLVGGVYAANTVGAVLGASAAAFVLVPRLGSLVAQQLLIAASVASALLVLVIAVPHAPRRRRAGRRPVLAAAAAAAGLVLAVSAPGLPGEFVAFGRFMPTRAAESEILYTREGIASSVAVSRDRNGRITYHNAGKAQASSYVQDMRLQRMLGHLTTLVPERPASVFVIGLGAGVTAGAVAVDPSVERVVVAEIEPLAADVAAGHFAPHNFDVLRNPKVELRIDDGRHYLATTDERFDAITSDPLDPWVKGAAALYTREFWELVESRLNPGGVVTVFLQLYENTEDAVRSEIATFLDVFENGAVFANTIQGTGYDAVLLGRAGDAPIDVDLVHARLTNPQYALVAESLRDVGFRSAAELLGTYAAHRADLTHWLDGAAINRDRNLRLQYLAGWGLNVNRADVIYDRIVGKGVELPESLFTGSPQRLNEVRWAARRR